MASDKSTYRLLSALSQFKEECGDDGQYKDVMEKADGLAAGLREMQGGQHAAESDKPSFDKASEKTKADFFGKKKDDPADTKDDSANTKDEPAK